MPTLDKIGSLRAKQPIIVAGFNLQIRQVTLLILVISHTYSSKVKVV